MAGVVALVIGIAGGADALAAKKTAPAPTLRALVRQTKALPRSLGKKKQHRALLHAAGTARRSFKGHACISVRQLSRYRRILARIHPKKGRRFGRANAKLERLGPTSLEASRRLLFSKKTKRCGGGKKLNTRKQPVTRILSSDENGMHLQVLLPAVQFGTQTGGGKTWTELSMPNTDSPQAPGKPGIPVVSKTFAMPDGSTLSVDPGKTSSYTLGGVDVYPAQPDPVDADTQPPNFLAGPFADKPFTLSRTTYASNSLFPSKPAAGDSLGSFRDLQLGGLQIAGAQYRPESQTLKVLTSVEVTLHFNGGPHTFNPEIASP